MAAPSGRVAARGCLHARHASTLTAPVQGSSGRAAMRRVRHLVAPAAVVAGAYVAGSVPFSQLAARWFAGQDLRRVGTGTVSGTGLYEVAGFGPLAMAGALDVAKGAVGPLLAGMVLRHWRPRVTDGGPARGGPTRGDSCLGALAAGAAIAGHDWSPWLRWRGGRGLSPALGSTLVLAPEGAAVLAAGMAVGRIVRQSGAVTAVAIVSLPAVLGASRAGPGVALGLCICVPMLAKRVLGNAPLRLPQDIAPRAQRTVPSLGARARSRLVFDRDPPLAEEA